MAETEWRILVRDENRTIIGEIDDEQSLDVRVRHLDAGAWTVTVDAGSASADLLQAGEGILFVVDGAIKLSGPKRPDSTEVTEEDGGRGQLTVSGVSDAATIARVIWPAYDEPITTSGTTQSSAYAVHSGAAETVIRTLVDRQAGPSALADRRQDGLVLTTDQGRGSTVTTKLRMDALLETVHGLAESGGIGWDIIQSGSDLELVFYEPADLAAIARFAVDLGNVTSYSYELTPPEVTDVIVGIGGEDVNRVFYRFQQRDALWPHLIVEEFADQRQVDPSASPGDDDYVDPDEAAGQAATERLEEGRGTASVSFSPIDTEQLVAGRDYDRGDVVTFETEVGPVEDTIREMRYTRDTDNGQLITPSIGEEQERPAIYRRVSGLRRDVNQLQTRR
ncbi:siphovirus ReqiPepy6 Gp37-like family protein [Streptomonospora litoralis]|uniref:siphovirus ReqiPepy6 Gp37-like family protein n=1 Tax=Streptomonospora litoralis TaxID=2498135 RepID=UPI0013F1699B|nr:siphovirus ReqiPepy6 Gp37-like family protein [Streptomonospora litoralis]